MRHVLLPAIAAAALVSEHGGPRSSGLLHLRVCRRGADGRGLRKPELSAPRHRDEHRHTQWGHRHHHAQRRRGARQMSAAFMRPRICRGATKGSAPAARRERTGQERDPDITAGSTGANPNIRRDARVPITRTIRGHPLGISGYLQYPQPLQRRHAGRHHHRIGCHCLAGRFTQFMDGTVYVDIRHADVGLRLQRGRAQRSQFAFEADNLTLDASGCPTQPFLSFASDFHRKLARLAPGTPGLPDRFIMAARGTGKPAPSAPAPHRGIT